MATCAECVHVEVCECDGTQCVGGVADNCSLFKNCSRFVELPFDVGDSYFEILATIDDETATIFEFHIDKIVQLKNAYGEPIGIFYEDRKAGRFQNALEPYSRRFRSREEAEQALKERESNGR